MSNTPNKIVELRKAKGYSQADFAELIGVSHPSLRKFEKGDTDKIPIGVAKEMAKLLDTSLSELVNLEIDNPPESNNKEEIKELKDKISKLEVRISEKDQMIRIINLQIDRKISDIMYAGIINAELMNNFLVTNQDNLGLNNDNRNEIFEKIQAAFFVSMDDCFIKFIDNPELKENNGDDYKSLPDDNEPHLKYMRDALPQARRSFNKL